MEDDSKLERVERGDHSLDESFKALCRETFEPLCLVNTDYEILTKAKRVDAVVVEGESSIAEELTIFSYFKVFNIIEFKSERDPFRFDRHQHKLLIYLAGVLEQEKGATWDNITFTLICTVKPKKLLNNFKSTTTIVRKGVYCIEGIFMIPLYLIIPDEVDETSGRLDKELALLKEFSRGSERERYLREIFQSVSKGNEEFTNHLGYAISLYRDEILRIAREEGLNMTLIEKNMRFWVDHFNLKDELTAEAEQKGITKGKTEDARKMLDKGLDIEFIHEITGLSHDEIRALKG